ncbi:hypothetical protein CYMTET_22900 [Cymbomonas tetramitiformis]|uniref:Polygalacturonase n=1 Tax=Cymbomonas tetramitiformis TaxID=36881 RepID=A0AAE0G0F6_9CHLO|nr:hypothetical protein CYMTET_22900 [Cymbomonas tetramitiformis]
MNDMSTCMSHENLYLRSNKKHQINGTSDFAWLQSSKTLRQAVLLLSQNRGLSRQCATSDATTLVTSAKHAISITEVGGVGDGQTDNTDAFHEAVKVIHKAGYGQIRVPPGTFLTGPFNLSSNMELYLEAGSTIAGLSDISKYALVAPLPSYGQGRDFPSAVTGRNGTGLRYQSLISAWHVSNVTITGQNGTIDGRGAVWWAAQRLGTINSTRGHLVEFAYCTDVQISHTTLQNSPFWTVHPFMCTNVVARQITILNPTNHSYAPNTDGIDPDSCENVLIEDSYFRTGDDAIAIKSGWDCYGYNVAAPSANIVIRNVTVHAPCCGGLVIGSEMSGGVRNVTLLDSTFVDTQKAIWLKGNPGRGGFIAHVNIHNIRVTGGKWAVMANTYYGELNPACHRSQPTSAMPFIHNVHINGLVAFNVETAGQFKGLADAPIFNVTLTNVTVDSKFSWDCSNVGGRASSHVKPTPCSNLDTYHSVLSVDKE